MFDKDLIESAAKLLEDCRTRQIRITTAESCTGGLLGGLLTETAGSSDVVDCGFIVYSNTAKARLLGVDPGIIESFGAVSRETAQAMAEGALDKSPNAQLAVSITGIAGPGGGSTEKPVGLVHFGVAGSKVKTEATHQVFPGNRQAVRQASLRQALSLLQAAVAKA
ncbi:MAG: CinA family protein [Pseudomonadota bacterium]